jgi:hypothetical protein
MASFHKSATCAAALGMCLSGTAALADLNAQDVWADWQAYMKGFGYDLTGDESMSGDTLTVTDLRMTMALPDTDGSMTMSMPRFDFTNNGDGTVTLTVPDSLPVAMRIEGPDGDDVDMKINYDTINFAMMASGDPNNLTYTYTADRLGLMLVELVVEGEPVEIGAAQIQMANLDGSSVVRVDDLRHVTQNLSTGAVSYLLDVVEPEFGDRVNVSGGLDSMSFDGTGTFPIELDVDDMSAMLQAGFAMDGTYRHQGSDLNFDVTEFGERTQVSASSDEGEIRVAIDQSRIAYDVGSDNVSFTFVSGDFPFPIEMTMARSAMNLLVPVGSSDAEQPFGFGLSLADFEISDLLWGMFDPAEQLPRDPATLSIDLTGMGRLFFDLLDADEMDTIAMQEGMPGELNSLKLNDLTLSAAGAALTGTGAFIFDNTDLETFDGLPAPDGSLDLRLVGANSLLDKLTAMGLLPQEQAMGARMMLGMFAVPGAGEDTLTSTIEVKPNGQILANGQRLQ